MTENIEPKEVEFTDLVGVHKLSGVDETEINVDNWGYSRNANCINFILDNVTYTAIEDESDGYRSSMDKIIVNSVEVKNTFEPVDVLVSYVTEPRDDYYGKCKMLYITDTLNGKTILVVGTENLDDYYPAFVASWMPENMAINEAKK